MHIALLVVFLSVIITIVTVIIYLRSGTSREIGDVLTLGPFVFFCLLLMLAIFAVYFTMAAAYHPATRYKTEYQNEITNEINLISARYDSKISGEGGALRGFVIQTDDVFRYYYKSNGAIRLGDVPADKSYIYYSDEQPKLITVNRDVVVYCRLGWLYWSLRRHETIYKFQVPEDSVVSEFVFN